MQHDVAVVGAGPAGAWTAYLLATRGAQVLLIDSSHPREKPCGGGVTGRALSLVAGAIGGELPAVTVNQARFVDSCSGRSAAVPLQGNGSLVVCSRSAFDGLLVSAACRSGARFARSRVRDVERNATGWRVLTDGGAYDA